MFVGVIRCKNKLKTIFDKRVSFIRFPVYHIILQYSTYTWRTHTARSKIVVCFRLFPQPKKHPCLTVAFWGLLANNFLYLFGYQIVLVHLVKHLINEGVFDDGNAGVAISAIGLFNMLGR